MSEVLSEDATLTTPFDSYENVRKFRVIDVPEPEEFEDKYFAPGIGRVFVETDFGDNGVPLNTLPLQSVTAIPLPRLFLPGLAILAVTGAASAYRRRRAAQG